MYKVFSLISIIIRQIYLPNPFINYFESSTFAAIFNIIIGEPLLYMLSFFLTSSIYEKGKDASEKGCILYCINYILNTALINFLCYNFTTISLSYIILIAFVINTTIWIISRKLKRKMHEYIF